MMAGAAVAIQASLTSAAQRTLGPVVLVVISGLTTNLVALAISLFLARPELTARAGGYSGASGVLGGLIRGSIACGGGQGWVAGRHSQSMVPSTPTRAAVCRLPITP